jgi:hypothetical protein
LKKCITLAVAKGTKQKQKDMSLKQEIKQELKSGKNFSNDSAEWFTVNRINKDGVMCISYKDEYKKYSTLEKYTNAVVKLLNTGSL